MHLRLLPLFTILAFAVAILSCQKELEPITTGTFTDPRDGHVYPTVTINGDTWFAANLAYLPSFNNLFVYDYEGFSPSEAKQTLSYQIYGCLYRPTDKEGNDWCPGGWHTPSDNEWMRLVRLAGGESLAATNMKSTTGWTDGDDGTNELGMNILPGGLWNAESGMFSSNGMAAAFHTSSKVFGWYGGSYTRLNVCVGVANTVGLSNEFGGSGRSIRCVKN